LGLLLVEFPGFDDDNGEHDHQTGSGDPRGPLMKEPGA
jgi:hypothetical protein